MKTWNKYLDDGEVKLGETVLEDHGFAFQKAHLQALIRSGELVPLLRERDGKLQVMSAADAWQKGDTIIYLLHAPKPKLLKRLSGSNHSTALKVEKLPEVEEVAVPASVRERANGQREEMAKRNPTEELKPTANDDNGQETLDKQGETPKGGKVQESPQFPNANESV